VNAERTFIGQFGNPDTSLSYLNARYYDGGRGQFLSEDPSFLTIADPNKLKQVTGQQQRSLLADPQQQNSYNYGRDNPVGNKDPSGNGPEIALVAPFIAAPEITVPAIAIGTLAAGLYIGTDYLVRNYGKIRYEPFDARRLPPPSMLGPQNTMDPFDGGPPNLGPQIPAWMKAVTAGALGSLAVQEFVDPLSHVKDFLTTNRATLQTMVSQNTPASQSRSPGVQSLLSQLSATLTRLKEALSTKKQ
jgi:RHS repeat-associated protein